MGSKQCSLWICTGLFDIDKRNLGSTSSRVEVLSFNVLPSFPLFPPPLSAPILIACQYLVWLVLKKWIVFHHFIFFVSIL